MRRRKLDQSRVGQRLPVWSAPRPARRGAGALLLVGDPGLRKGMGAAARRHAVDRFGLADYRRWLDQLLTLPADRATKRGRARYTAFGAEYHLLHSRIDPMTGARVAV